jgi:hypothetical protein
MEIVFLTQFTFHWIWLLVTLPFSQGARLRNIKDFSRNKFEETTAYVLSFGNSDMQQGIF